MGISNLHLILCFSPSKHFAHLFFPLFYFNYILFRSFLEIDFLANFHLTFKLVVNSSHFTL